MHPFVAALACLRLAPELGGLVLRARPSPQRQRWLAFAAAALGVQPLPRVPLGITDDRLYGGLDLSATVRLGRPQLQQGLLAQAHGRALLLPMAERQPEAVLAALQDALDRGVVTLARDGLQGTYPARFVLLAVDEGDAEEAAPERFLERLAFPFFEPAVLAPPPFLPMEADLWPEASLMFELLEGDEPLAPGASVALEEGLGAPRARLAAQGPLPRSVVRALGELTDALAVPSSRALGQAALTLRCLCAWADCALDTPEALASAAALVLAPRARQALVNEPPADSPAPAPPPQSTETPEPPAPTEGGDQAEAPTPEGLSASTEVLLEAIATAVPEAWLAAASACAKAQRARAGRVGARTRLALRGRPRGVRAGTLAPGDRLNVPATLRAAAPFAKLRPPPAPGLRFALAPEDFRIQCYETRSATTTLFVVDASGSAALQRLGEAKGAVEAMLADSYARRDEVAMMIFRGEHSDLVLPPTRALVRARRALAGVPGGGATPLAKAVQHATTLAQDIARQGRQPLVVFLTDGRGNIALDGRADRAQAQVDTERAARAFAFAGLAGLVLDTGRRPEPRARVLAEHLGAAYAPLPRQGAAAIAQLVTASRPRSAAAP
jgi:magnesium chelatase subunit D